MSVVRDMAQGLLDRFAGFVRGHATSDRAHPGVGVAFIIAALIVLLLGFRWFTDSDDASGTTNAQDWALDVPGESGSPTTTIGASPEAVAVRVGTAVPHGAEDDQSVTIGIPGTSIEIEIPLSPTTTRPGSSGNPGTGGTTPGGGPTTTRPRTTPTTRPGGGTTTPTSPPTTDPPTTDPPTTEEPTTEPPTTEEPTTEPPTTETPPELTGLTIEVPPVEIPPVELPPVDDTSETGDVGLVGALVGTIGSLLT
jgi:hypothetical protein